MKTKNLFIAATVILALFWGVFAVPAQTSETTGKGDSVLQSFSGTVEILKSGAADWTPATEKQTLKVGDKIRTGKNSRAVVQLSNLSILRVYERTTLEIQPPAQSGQSSTLDLKAGAVYFFNRDKPQSTQFRTPSASGAIRGTEFNLAVAEDGRMLLTLVDGAVDLQNELGTLELKTGEQAVVEPGKAPQKTPSVDAINVIQWTLYYPGIVDVDELGLEDDLKVQLAPSLDAYRQGDLLKAVDSYPFDRESQSPADKVYRSALFLVVGNVDSAQNLLQNLGEGRPAQIGEALKELIAAVKNQTFTRSGARSLATECMAASYYHQSRADLESALSAAKDAAAKSPGFGFAHARVAELEFGFGRTDAAKAALDKSLSLSPRNAQAVALKGFLLAAKNKIGAARNCFDEAIQLDGSLGNAWLGRGLVKIKKGKVEDGRKDLQTAASLEPNRALFRSYLGKAWSMGRPFMYSWDQVLATKELNLARSLDPNDPTPWLYSALLEQQRNRVNTAVEDLERSQRLNDNRRLFRSKMLLDQDRAVRSANLASIYRDAGMTEYSIREAGKAVDADPANFSAHLFLSESYDAMRDPRSISLRYETAWQSELLLANLLAPVGAGSLSRNVSQQEYSKLFEADKLGLSSRTEYFSSGDWLQQVSQFGTLGNSSYALDFEYRKQAGFRPNNDFENRYYSAKFKQQITEKDGLFLQVDGQNYRSGDVLQRFYQNTASTTLRIKEVQEPNLFVGYHREWSPGNHTLLLLGRLDDTFTMNDSKNEYYIASLSPLTGDPIGLNRFTGSNNYASDLTAYTAELQQIWQPGRHTILLGGRFQVGETDNRASQVLPNTIFTTNHFFGSSDPGLRRGSVYLYDYWQLFEPLQLSAGVSYDNLRYPVNTDITPLSNLEKEADQISPKVALRYTPWENTTFRAAFTRSLGGVFFDNNYRLEPSQMGGFTQSYRSMIPESTMGAVAGSRFTTIGVGMEQKFKTRTYLTLEAELLESDADRAVGIFETTITNISGNAIIPATTSQKLRFQERALTLTVSQLLGDEWAVGGRYRISDSDLTDRLPEYPNAILPPSMQARFNNAREATLQQATLFALYNHRCGFFARADAHWVAQRNNGYDNTVNAGDDFWQFNAYAGYRFPRRQAEIRLGVLNISDEHYSINPLSYYVEYPRERMFMASLKVAF